MRETILRDFFRGKATASDLARDVKCATKKSSAITSVTSVEGMDDEFTVTADMAVQLCDAVLSGDLPPEALGTIGFALIASDKFCWDGDEDEVLADVIADWSCPEINYPLTVENVRRFRAWLLRSEPYPAKPNMPNANGDIISIREKKSLKRRWRRS